MKYRVKRHAVTQPLNQSYRLIALTRNQTAIVSVKDYKWLNQFNWHAHWNPPTKSFYAARHKKTNNKHYPIVQMAQEILQCGPNKEPDHKNHDTLDNRRKNLRKATRSQNNSNQKLRSDNTSGYKGVYWFKLTGKWRAQVRHKGKIVYLKFFTSDKKAAHARDKIAKKYHGKFAILNFP